VQETYLRAWRAYAGFEGRASIRSWLYKIATNACLTALEPRRMRVLPSGLTGPDDEPDRPPTQLAPGEVSWLEPLPDRWIAPAVDDPAAAVVARESLRLALIASLQYLPPRQRAILILRDVLAFSAAETAEILGTTATAVKSGLQRARARLDELEPAPEELLEPTDERARALLERYITAFERSDAGLLEQVLRADATLEATPFREWQAGRVKCIHLLDAYVLGAAGDWRMVATAANGQPAAVVYHRDTDGVLRAHGIVVLATTANGVSRVVEFHDPGLVLGFGFPDVLTDRSRLGA
jgi:RNA polymerase sigma-70 factor (TIGR02960 family)